MYEIKSATVLNDTNKVTFLPNVNVGEDVIIVGENNVESGTYTRKKALGELERKVQVGASIKQTFWSRTAHRIEHVTGTAGGTLICSAVNVTTHYMSYYGGYAVFTAPGELLFDTGLSIIPEETLDVRRPHAISVDGKNVMYPLELDSRIVLERGDTLTILTRPNVPRSLTLVFHAPIW